MSMEETPTTSIPELTEEQTFELVREFQPILYQPQHDKHIPKFMYYRTARKEDTLKITYYTVWDNERHPRYFFHVLYSFLFRKFYYGSIKDIEYIQIDVDLKTRDITDVRFEQASKPDYHVFFPFHRKNHLKRVPQPEEPASYENVFIRFFGQKNEFHGLIKPRFSGKRIHMAVTSWNHIYNVYLEDLHKYIKDLGDNFNTFTSLVLKKYDPKEFKKYKANRRSKGEF